MNIRNSYSEEVGALCALHEQAFGESEGPVISRLVAELLADLTAQPLLSLVAEGNAQLTGHVIFSAVNLGDVTGAIMAPLAIAQNCQRKGIGSALINHGFDLLRKKATPFVLVYGDPKYYTRFGFSAGHNIDPPHKLAYSEAWMAHELESGALANLNGVALCADSLMAPEYW